MITTPRQPIHKHPIVLPVQMHPHVVEGWLLDILRAEGELDARAYHPVEDSDHNRNSTRKRRRILGPVDTNTLQLVQSEHMSPDKRQGFPRRLSPRKTKHTDIGHGDGDTERTPRAPQRTESSFSEMVKQYGQQPAFPIHEDAPSSQRGSDPFINKPNLSPSKSSNSANSAARSNASDGRSVARESSPAKLRKLRMFDEAGIELMGGATKLSSLDTKAKALYTEIRNSDYGQGVIPLSIKGELEILLEQIGDGMPPPFAYCQDDTRPALDEQVELRAMTDIVAETAMKTQRMESEAAWNCDVHSPLLKIALRPFREALWQMNL